MNQGIHGIDLLQWFMGDVESVCSYKGTLAHENIEVEDTAVAILKFKNGALGVIEGTTSVYPDIPQRLELHGTNGTIVL
jgi:predicted dehydrogenase